ncbi:dodecin family protein, partial [Thioalkalivibrio sp.]|uniref:dodecin family protein n=1 Tax=Thioalkalivibrio sp. TaxID=2093813 RepID=UPI0039750573
MFLGTAASAGSSVRQRCDAGASLQKNLRRNLMTVAKVTEITAESTKSFEDAIQQGLDRASTSLHG